MVGYSPRIPIGIVGYNSNTPITHIERIVVAEQPTRDFTQMSVQELNNLVVSEGRKFVEQTQDGDISFDDYIESENFDLTRLMNLFFAFEYFERTEHGNKNKVFAQEYDQLYLAIANKLEKLFGGAWRTDLFQ